MLGVFSYDAAQRMADEKNLDLVLISPTANPVVCKIMDYAKFRYERIKAEKEEKNRQTNVELKELWLSAVIDIGDLKTKAKKAREIIELGDRLRLSIRMKGRQLAHPELSVDIMKKFLEMVSDIALVERAPTREARSISMIIVPTPAVLKAAKEKAEQAVREKDDAKKAGKRGPN